MVTVETIRTFRNTKPEMIMGVGSVIEMDIKRAKMLEGAGYVKIVGYPEPSPPPKPKPKKKKKE